MIEITDTPLRHIATEIWPSRIVMVFDYLNVNYDFENAHIPESVTVFAIHFIAQGKVKVGQAGDRVNKEVAELHNLNGNMKPPFLADHTKGNAPYYDKPREGNGVSTAQRWRGGPTGLMSCRLAHVAAIYLLKGVGSLEKEP